MRTAGSGERGREGRGSDRRGGAVAAAAAATPVAAAGFAAGLPSSAAPASGSLRTSPGAPDSAVLDEPAPALAPALLAGEHQVVARPGERDVEQPRDSADCARFASARASSWERAFTNASRAGSR